MLWWRGRWEGGLGWGILVNPWLIHVNVWQKPLQYCKVISLQLIKINEKKSFGHICVASMLFFLTIYLALCHCHTALISIVVSFKMVFYLLRDFLIIVFTVLFCETPTLKCHRKVDTLIRQLTWFRLQDTSSFLCSVAPVLDVCESSKCICM